MSDEENIFENEEEPTPVTNSNEELETKTISLESLKGQIVKEVLPDLASVPVQVAEDLQGLAAEIAEDITAAIALGRTDLTSELRNQIYALGRVRKVSISSTTMQAVAKTAGIVIRTLGAAIIAG